MNFTHQGNRKAALFLTDHHADIFQQVFIVLHGEFDCRLVSNSLSCFSEFDEGSLTAEDFPAENNDSGYKNEE